MSLQRTTLLLDAAIWDLVMDASRNIALAAPPYAVAQDVASAARTFFGEVYYDTTIGIPYFAQILGQTPPVSVFEAYEVAAALTVPGVVSATCVIESFENRTVSGQIQFIDDTGGKGIVNV
jgi:hypothetical protein